MGKISIINNGNVRTNDYLTLILVEKNIFIQLFQFIGGKSDTKW